MSAHDGHTVDVGPVVVGEPLPRFNVSTVAAHIPMSQQLHDELTGSAPVDVAARGVPIRVVAVKWPRHWIIRGIACFKSAEQVAEMVRPFVAIVPPDEMEWTTHEYTLPSYLAYGTGPLPRIGWPGGAEGGVFLFAHQGGDVYRADARRLATP